MQCPFQNVRLFPGMTMRIGVFISWHDSGIHCRICEDIDHHKSRIISIFIHLYKDTIGTPSLALGPGACYVSIFYCCLFTNFDSY